MQTLLNRPVVLFVFSFAFLWAATRLGTWLQIWHGQLDESRKGDFDIVLGATLTLLSLIVGFSFSMASSRYDQRKNYEEDEANAIGTVYARADLLPGADAVKIQQLLREYTAQRIRFYTTVDAEQVRDLNRGYHRDPAPTLEDHAGRCRDRLAHGDYRARDLGHE